MRIIDKQAEAREILEMLPKGLKKANPKWGGVEAACFALRSDFLYFDVVAPQNLQHIPEILRKIGQQKCYVFNQLSLLEQTKLGGAEFAFEIKADCSSEKLIHEFGTEGKDHNRYLSVFYFVGDFGLISAESDWFIFARTDNRAIFSAKYETVYSDFNRVWWNSVAR